MPEAKQIKQQPEPSALTEELARRIADEGPMTVAAFMEAAASHYYATRNLPFGADGDFVTAPEISQMFGEMIAAWFVDLWMQAGNPDRVQLIELGPGRGTLTADILRTLSSWPDLKSAISIHLVETSSLLRQEQARALKAYRPVWYDRLEEVPDGRCFIVANEFFDALPIHQFRKIEGKWRERCIDYDAVERQFFFTAQPAKFDVASVMPRDFLGAPDGSIFEISPASLSVMEEITRRVASFGGAGLVVDYGHAVPGLGDTLQCVENHRYSDVLENPGAKDITAHVDFATLKMAAAGHADVHGPVTQGEFLKRLGIEQRAEALRRGGGEAKDVALALHRLTAPSEMGGLFKVMGLTPKGGAEKPAGFGDEVPDDAA